MILAFLDLKKKMNSSPMFIQRSFAYIYFYAKIVNGKTGQVRVEILVDFKLSQLRK